MVCAAYEGCLSLCSADNNSNNNPKTTMASHLPSAGAGIAFSTAKSEASSPDSNMLKYGSPQSYQPLLDCKESSSVHSSPDSSAGTSGGAYGAVSSSISGTGISEGQLFLHFLQFFSRMFDPSTQGIGT